MAMGCPSPRVTGATAQKGQNQKREDDPRDLSTVGHTLQEPEIYPKTNTPDFRIACAVLVQALRGVAVNTQHLLEPRKMKSRS